ncbi:glycerophosphodiester phosphodiesterase [uncultured Microbulbifer sp.]|uniref:glycerophosphodiester phosphodiesterase n=1 Tax=uncultured Microbulbifer sp. TaxID=348147 RepID=UPI0025F9982C|nr:glycerophosphodiester phosphodiesterase [uncultured Microbulbifer sp.]
MRKILYWLLLLVLFGLAIRWLAPGWIDEQYREAVAGRPQLPGNVCRKGWGHRGLVNEDANIRENTVASVRNAFTAGAAGVEVDILYDRESGRFIVSHDRPYQRDEDGEPLDLRSLFEQVGSGGYFWLDAKDLRELAPWVASDAVAQLAGLIRELGMRERVFVESRHALYLSWLAEQGIHTSLMISPNEHKYSRGVFRANLYLAKLAYTWGPFSAFSMNDYRYTAGVAEELGVQVPVLVSTVNDRAAFQRFADSPAIAVVLTDRPFFDYRGCKN